MTTTPAIARRALAIAAVLSTVGISATRGQAAPGDSGAKAHKTPAFWTTTTPFELTLTVNLKQLRSDRTEKAPWRVAAVRYTQDTTSITRPARVRTRGISRLKICSFFPPIWVDFTSKETKGTAFSHMNRFKLVSPCKSGTDYDRYVLEEYALYRVAATVTPIHHETRLVRLTVVDSATGKTEFTRWSFALEDADELATRIGGKKIIATGASGDDLDPRQTAVMGVLQYMIGNTDFSINVQHNAEIFLMGGAMYPIVYDFDQAGAINPPYAIPDKSLGIRAVTERIYRGLCVPNDTLTKVLADFRAQRPAVEAIYRNDMAKLIGGAAVSQTLKYFDDFYSDIGNPGTVKHDISSQCRGTR